MSDRGSTPPELLRLRIEKPIYGGAGFARDNGKAIFIPYTLPGEYVSASVTYNKQSFAEASVAEILEASPDRADPPCPWFGRCGGCHYQHATYLAQLTMKSAILSETLTRARLAELPAIVTHSGQPLGYRNRIRLHLDSFTSALGYRERASHRLLTVDQCPIAAHELEHALRALATVSEEQQCGSYFSQAELSVNHNGSELLLAVWYRDGVNTREAAPRLTRLCESLQLRLPALRGAGLHAPEGTGPQTARGRNQARRMRSNHGPGAIEDAAPILAKWGTTKMTYTVAGLDYRVSLGAFFQVNRTLLDTLVQIATGGRRGMLAWDLYAGVGLFSRVLARHFEQVVAVEGAPTSAEDLRTNLGSRHQSIRSSTLDFLRREVARPPTGKAAGATPDFVLLDPPRAGLGEEATRLLTQIGPSDVTYVSCDPATLSRDLRTLLDSGYKLQQLHLIDLFPQTFHLETVVMLSRR